MNDARLKEAIARRQWKANKAGKVSFQVEKSLFNEMLMHLNHVPRNVEMAILPDSAFHQIFRMLAKFLETEIHPRLQEIHGHGYSIAMQESHLTQPFSMTVHYLSDGEMVYVTRDEMLPYASHESGLSRLFQPDNLRPINQKERRKRKKILKSKRRRK